MKIAIVIERFFPTAGGNERSTQQIARQLVARGHDVTVLTSAADTSEAAQGQGGRVVAMNGRLGTKSGFGLLAFAQWAERRQASDGYDVSLSMTPAVPATVVQPRGGTVRETLARNVAMRSGYFRRCFKKAALALNFKQLSLLAAERRTYDHPRVKKIVAISRYVADQLFHHYSVSSRRIVEIPNAAEVRHMDLLERAMVRRRVRAAMGVGDNDVAFLFAARNPGLKGLPFLLDALAEARKLDSRAKLIVAGSLGLGAMKPVARLGLSDAVKWVGPTRLVDPLYTAADVTVLPSWYDPSSKVVLESLLHGVPAISTLYNGASQWIFSPTGREKIPSPFDRVIPSLTPVFQQAGRVIDSPRNVAAMARAIVELCDSDERERCAAATLGLANHIDMKHHVERLEFVLQEAAGER